jgi:hypothetical protein
MNVRVYDSPRLTFAGGGRARAWRADAMGRRVRDRGAAAGGAGVELSFARQPATAAWLDVLEVRQEGRWLEIHNSVGQNQFSANFRSVIGVLIQMLGQLAHSGQPCEFLSLPMLALPAIFPPNMRVRYTAMRCLFVPRRYTTINTLVCGNSGST